MRRVLYLLIAVALFAVTGCKRDSIDEDLYYELGLDSEFNSAYGSAMTFTDEELMFHNNDGDQKRTGVVLLDDTQSKYLTNLDSGEVVWFLNRSAVTSIDLDKCDFEFVPMLYGGTSTAAFKESIIQYLDLYVESVADDADSQLDNSASAVLKMTGGKISKMVGFYQPELSSGANLSAEEAFKYWPALMELGIPLASPVVETANDGDESQKWLSTFMDYIDEYDYRVDYIYVQHIYDAIDAVRLQEKLEAIHTLYPDYPIIVELSLRDWDTTGKIKFSQGDVLNFMEANLDYLDSDAVKEYVYAYAWVSYPGEVSALFDDSGDKSLVAEYLESRNPDIVPDIEPNYAANMISNPYFEDKIDDWSESAWSVSDSEAVKQITSLDSGYATISGTSSIVMVDSDKKVEVAQSVAVDGGATYHFGLRGRIQKAEGAESVAESVEGAEYITIKIYNGDVNVTAESPNYGYFFTPCAYVDSATSEMISETTITASNNSDLSATITLPQHCKRATIVVEKSAAGVAYVDNLYLVKTTEAPAAIEVPKGADNLVVNGDFEDGTTGWTLSKAAITESNTIRGAKSMLLTYNGGNPQINNSIPVTVGETYVYGFTGRIQSEEGAEGSANVSDKKFLALNLQAAGGTAVSMAETERVTTSTNTTVYFEYTVPEGVTSVSTRFVSTAGCAYIDDVFFYSKSNVETEFADGFYYPSEESNLYVNGTFETFQETGIYGASAGYRHSTVENNYDALSGFGGSYVGQLAGGESYTNVIQTLEGNFKAGDRFQFGMVGCVTTIDGKDSNSMSLRMFVRAINSSNAVVVFDSSKFVYNNDLEYVTTSDVVNDYAGVVTLPDSYTKLQVVIAGISTNNVDDLAHFDYVYFVPYGSSNNMGVGDVDESPYSDIDAQKAYPLGYTDAASYNVISEESIADGESQIFVVEDVEEGAKYRFGFGSESDVEMSIRNVVGSYGNYDYDTTIPNKYYNLFTDNENGVYAGYMTVPANVSKVAICVESADEISDLYFADVEDWYSQSGNIASHSQVDSGADYYDTIGANMLLDGGFTLDGGSSPWSFTESGATIFESRMLRLEAGGVISQSVDVVAGSVCDFGFEARLQGGIPNGDEITMSIYDGEKLMSSASTSAITDTFVLIEGGIIPDDVTSVTVKISMSGDTNNIYGYLDNAFAVMTDNGLGYPAQLDIDGAIEAGYNIGDFSNFLKDSGFVTGADWSLSSDEMVVTSQISSSDFGSMLAIDEDETAKSSSISFASYESYTFGFTGRVADGSDEVKMVMYNAANNIPLAVASTNSVAVTGQHATASYANPDDGSVESIYFQIEKSGSVGTAYVDNGYVVQTVSSPSTDVPTDHAGMLAAYPNGIESDDDRNIVRDGGFEVYALKNTAWTIANSASILSDSDLLYEDGVTSKILKLTGATTTNTLQEISVEPGASYRFGAIGRIVDASGNGVTNGNKTTYLNLVVKSAADGEYKANTMLSDYDTYETSEFVTADGFIYSPSAIHIKGVITIPDDLSKIRLIIAKPAAASETSTIAYVDNVYFAKVDDYDFEAKDTTEPIAPDGYSYSSIPDISMNEVVNYNFASADGWEGDGEYFALESYSGESLYKLSGADGRVKSTTAVTPEAGEVKFGFIARLDSGSSVVMNLVDGSGAIKASTAELTTKGVDTVLNATYTTTGGESLYAQIVYAGDNSVGRAYVDDVYVISPIAKVPAVAPSGYDISSVLGEHKNLLAESGFDTLSSWMTSGTVSQCLDSTNGYALYVDGSAAISAPAVNVMKFSKYQFGFAGRAAVEESGASVVMRVEDQNGNIVAESNSITSTTDTYESERYTIGESVTSLTVVIENEGSGATYVDNAYLMMTYDSTQLTDEEAAASYPDGIVLGDSYSQYNKVCDPGLEEIESVGATGPSTTDAWYKTSNYVSIATDSDALGSDSNVFKFAGNTTANVLQNFTVEGGNTYKIGLVGKVTSADGGAANAGSYLSLNLRSQSNVIYEAVYDENYSDGRIYYEDGVAHLSAYVYVPEGDNLVRMVVVRGATSGNGTDIGYADNIYCAKVADYYGGVSPDATPKPEDVVVDGFDLSSVMGYRNSNLISDYTDFTSTNASTVESESGDDVLKLNAIIDGSATATFNEAMSVNATYKIGFTGRVEGGSSMTMAVIDAGGNELKSVEINSAIDTYVVSEEFTPTIAGEAAITLNLVDSSNSSVAYVGDIFLTCTDDGVYESVAYGVAPDSPENLVVDGGFEIYPLKNTAWTAANSSVIVEKSYTDGAIFDKKMLKFSGAGSTYNAVQYVSGDFEMGAIYGYGFTSRIHSEASVEGDSPRATESYTRMNIRYNNGKGNVDFADLYKMESEDVVSNKNTHFFGQLTLPFDISKFTLIPVMLPGVKTTDVAYVDNVYLYKISDPISGVYAESNIASGAVNLLADSDFESADGSWSLSGGAKRVWGVNASSDGLLSMLNLESGSTAEQSVSVIEGETYTLGFTGRGNVTITLNGDSAATIDASNDTYVETTGVVIASGVSTATVEITALSDSYVGEVFLVKTKESSTGIAAFDRVVDETNRLAGGDFEGDTTSWTFNNATVEKDVVGTNVMKMTGGNATAQSALFAVAAGSPIRFGFSARVMNSIAESSDLTSVKATLYRADGSAVAATDNVSTIVDTNVERTYYSEISGEYYIVVSSMTTESSDLVYIDNLFVADPAQIIENGDFEVANDGEVSSNHFADYGWNIYNGGTKIVASNYATNDDGSNFFEQGGEYMLHQPDANNAVNYFYVETGATYKYGCSVYVDRNVSTTTPVLTINLTGDGNGGVGAATSLAGSVVNNTKTDASHYNVATELGGTYVATAGGGLKLIVVRGGTNNADHVYVDNVYMYKIKDAETGIE